MSQADKEAIICMAKAFGKDESWLTNRYGYNSHVSGWEGIMATDGRVTAIDWGNERLTGSIPKEIGDLTHLRCLDLHYNFLSGDIPIELCKLTNLRTLRLYSNHLSCEMPDIRDDRNKVIQFFETEKKRVSQILSQSIPNQYNCIVRN